MVRCGGWPSAQSGRRRACLASTTYSVVAYLATEKCPLTGKVFAVQGGNIQELQTWTSVRGIDNDGPWTIENIAEKTADWS